MKLHHLSGLLANIGNASIFHTEKRTTVNWVGKAANVYYRVSRRAQEQKSLHTTKFRLYSLLFPLWNSLHSRPDPRKKWTKMRANVIMKIVFLIFHIYSRNYYERCQFELLIRERQLYHHLNKVYNLMSPCNFLNNYDLTRVHYQNSWVLMTCRVDLYCSWQSESMSRMWAKVCTIHCVWVHQLTMSPQSGNPFAHLL
jgi:hypothetical protein